jgi:hypothetical protein
MELGIALWILVLQTSDPHLPLRILWGGQAYGVDSSQGQPCNSNSVRSWTFAHGSSRRSTDPSGGAAKIPTCFLELGVNETVT